jgi:hypothetical protein
MLVSRASEWWVERRDVRDSKGLEVTDTQSPYRHGVCEIDLFYLEIN